MPEVFRSRGYGFFFYMNEGQEPQALRRGPAQVQNVELTCNGTGLHWPDLDEDLSVGGIIEGRFGYGT